MTRYADIQFAVLRGRETVNPWLAAFGGTCANYKEFAGPKTWRETFNTRNEMLQWFLADTTLPWLFMSDDDIVLTLDSKPLLESEADVTTPHVVGTDGTEGHRRTMATGAIKFSRKAVELLVGKWKAPASSCGCNQFHNVCVRAGIQPVKAGIVGHVIPVIAWPGGEYTPQPTFPIATLMALWEQDKA